MLLTLSELLIRFTKITLSYVLNVNIKQTKLSRYFCTCMSANLIDEFVKTAMKDFNEYVITLILTFSN